MKRFADLFWTWLLRVALFCFMATLVVMMFQVLFRNILRIAVPWTDELSRYLFIWAIFLGSAIAQRSREHIRITMIVERLPATGQRVASALTDAFSLVVSAGLLVGAVKMMQSTYGILASTLPVSFAYVYFSLALCVAVALGLLARDLFRLATRRAEASIRGAS